MGVERPKAEGERKQLTVLFSDVKGSMDLQEDLDAEDWARLMNRFVELVADEVDRFGGTVDKFTGDGVMALFGAPAAQEDHARRACHAAWRIADAVGRFAEELRASGDTGIEVRIGLNSGGVVVGPVGEAHRLEPTALGHTVGLAQRMEALATPGKVYLTEHTAHLVESWFDLEDLGAQPIKGARDPLRVFALGPPRLSPRPRPRALGAAPLVGRQAEMHALHEALAAARQRQARVVGLVGEAGVGKTRLCDEFARAVMAEGITVRRTAGLSHGTDVPLLPVLALLRDYFSITADDNAAEARQKVRRRLLVLDPALEDVVPLLWDFLEIPDPERPAPKLAADVRMRRIAEALSRVTARRSDQEVLVLLVEDLHWFDPQSCEFLDRTIASHPGTRTLVVVNFRPGFSAPWMGSPDYESIVLRALDGEAVSALVSGLLGSDPSLAPLLSFVQERTGGNPFFVEEMLRALVENGTLEGRRGSYRLCGDLDSVAMPPSVQAVIAARIDRLPPDEKRLLQIASVIGRSFTESVLGTVAAMGDGALRAQLDALCAAEFVRRSSRRDAEYRFWHPLTQEVAYESLLIARRAGLHAAVAEAVESEAGDRADELAGVLAWHWERAGRRVDAARWQLRAGEFALRSDLAEALRRWHGVIALSDDADPTPEALRLGVQARTRLIQYGGRTGMDLSEADRLFDEARTRAERLGDVRRLTLLVYLAGSPLVWQGHVQAGLARYLEGCRLGEGDPDPDWQAFLYGAPALAMQFTGPLGDALAWADRELEACAGDPDRAVSYLGYSAQGRALQIRAAILLAMGRLAEGATDLARSLAIARPRGDVDTLCWALGTVPYTTWLAGEPVEASSEIAEAIRIAEDTGNIAGLVIAWEGMALVDLAAGRPGAAAEHCERGLSLARQRRSGLFREPSLLAHLALARLAHGDTTGAASAADDAVAVARRQGTRVLECLALLTRGQVARRSSGAAPAIEADLNAALHLVETTGARVYEPAIHEELGHLHSDQRRLEDAWSLYRAIGASGHTRRLGAELRLVEPERS